MNWKIKSKHSSPHSGVELINVCVITFVLVLFIACENEPVISVVPTQPTPDIEATVQARVSKELNNQPLPTPSISSTDVEKAIATAVAKAISESITPTTVPTITPNAISLLELENSLYSFAN